MKFLLANLLFYLFTIYGFNQNLNNLDSLPPPIKPPGYSKLWVDYRERVNNLRDGDTLIYNKSIDYLKSEKDSNITNARLFFVANKIIENGKINQIKFIVENISLNFDDESINPEFYRLTNYPFFYSLYIAKNKNKNINEQIFSIVISNDFLNRSDLTEVELKLLCYLIMDNKILTYIKFNKVHNYIDNYQDNLKILLSNFSDGNDEFLRDNHINRNIKYQ
ncbi:MAG: hypothetical protein R2771_13595 [Saprospiraceae bacterium]